MGKSVLNSKQSCKELKSITDNFFSKNHILLSDTIKLTRELLLKYINSFRRDDGSNPITTVSFPTSCDGIVVGVRYTKNSGRQTEDHFLFRPDTNLYKCKGKELSKICPEYAGTHELQIPTITQ